MFQDITTRNMDMLETFAGDPLEWPEWTGLFTATVHNANIVRSEKMNYLKALYQQSRTDIVRTQLKWQLIRICLKTVVRALPSTTYHI